MWNGSVPFAWFRSCMHSFCEEMEVPRKDSSVSWSWSHFVVRDFFFFCWCFFCGCQIYVNGICWDWQVCAVWDIAWLQVLFAGWFLCLQVLRFSFTLVFPFGVVSFQIDVCVISNANRDDVCLINESFWCSLLQSKSKQTLLRYYEKSRPNFFPLCYDSIVSIN